MPQLMPLNWMFSIMMIFVILMSAGVIYSEKLLINMTMNGEEENVKMLNFWCW